MDSKPSEQRLQQMTLRELLDEYATARLERRSDEMARLAREIDLRQRRGEAA